MAIKESALSLITSIAQGDWVRAVTSAGASRRVTVANLAKAIVESYTGSSLAGASQSVKSALDSLNSNTGSIACSISSTAISWRKSGKWVNVVFDGAINAQIPAGAYTTLGTFPSNMLPNAYVIADALRSRVDNRLMIEVQPSGVIRCYNYGTALASGTSVRFNIMYLLA